jgi:hypothetical protein
MDFIEAKLWWLFILAVIAFVLGFLGKLPKDWR